jgi:hypothetical protein
MKRVHCSVRTDTGVITMHALCLGRGDSGRRRIKRPGVERPSRCRLMGWRCYSNQDSDFDDSTTLQMQPGNSFNESNVHHATASIN